MMDTPHDQSNNRSTPFPSPTARKRKSNEQCYQSPNDNQNQEEDDSWVDVYKNIKRMDALYDATFYTWLKSEENVFVTSIYLYRIANQYPLQRIMNGLKWLISDWRLESIRVLVEKVTQDWNGSEGDARRGTLLKHMTHNWAPQYTASLISNILSSPPYVYKPSQDTTGCEPSNQSEKNINISKARFLKQLTYDYDYSKLSEFLMYLGPGNSGTCPHANSLGGADGSMSDGIPVLDFRIKLVLLQDAAHRENEREKQRKSSNVSGTNHGKANSSDQTADNKRPRLSAEEDDVYSTVAASSSVHGSFISVSGTNPRSNVINPIAQGSAAHTHTRNSSMSSVTSSSHTRNSSMSSVNSSSTSITATTPISAQNGVSPSISRSTYISRSRRHGRRNSYSYNPMLILTPAAVNDTSSASSNTTSTTSISPPSNAASSAANASSILDSAMIREDVNTHKSVSSASETVSNNSLAPTNHQNGITAVDEDTTMICDGNSAGKRRMSHDI